MSAKKAKIPALNKYGNLPPGVHETDIEGLISRFGSSKSLKRNQIANSIREFYNFIKFHAIALYIDGSFTTSKLSPGDVDLIVVLPPTFFKNNVLAAVRLIEFNQNPNLHIFSYPKGHSEIANFVKFFSHDRTGNEKGIIYIKVKNDKKL